MTNAKKFIQNFIMKKLEPIEQECIDFAVYTNEEVKDSKTDLMKEGTQKFRTFCSIGKNGNEKGYLKLKEGEIKNSFITIIGTEKMSKYDNIYEDDIKTKKIKTKKRKR